MHNVDDVDLRIDLERAYARLTERQRAALALVIVGLTQEEAAQEIGVGRSAVTRRIGRAREHLGDEM